MIKIKQSKIYLDVTEPYSPNCVCVSLSVSFSNCFIPFLLSDILPDDRISGTHFLGATNFLVFTTAVIGKIDMKLDIWEYNTVRISRIHILYSRVWIPFWGFSNVKCMCVWIKGVRNIEQICSKHITISPNLMIESLKHFTLTRDPVHLHACMRLTAITFLFYFLLHSPFTKIDREFVVRCNFVHDKYLFHYEQSWVSWSDCLQFNCTFSFLSSNAILNVLH